MRTPAGLSPFSSHRDPRVMRKHLGSQPRLKPWLMRQPLAPLWLLVLLYRLGGNGIAIALGVAAEGAVRIHMVTYVTEQYRDRFASSLKAKEAYAKRWGYAYHVFDEETLDCDNFRTLRWPGDYRYCKMEALEVMRERIRRSRDAEAGGGEGGRDVLFWHDTDTHILRPDRPLGDFLRLAGDDAGVVFTDNALSLNNGVFFLDLASDAANKFLNRWRSYCSEGVWPWADNGCMYEVLLQHLGGDRYHGRCEQYREPEHDPEKPEPRTGTALMRCFNEEMSRLGMGCCGSARGVPGFGLLTGREASFNDHRCEDLERNPEFTEAERGSIGSHCFYEGMFMVHSKRAEDADESERRVAAMSRKRSEL